MKVNIHHIGKVVRNIAEELENYSQLGFEVDRKIYIDQEQKVKVGKVKAGEVLIELLEPLDETSPISKFHRKQGGVHHISIMVKDIDDYVRRFKADRLGFVLTKKTTSVFDQRTVCFISTNNREIIELIEKNQYDKVIFRTKEKDFRFADIVTALKEAGVEKGDTLMVHADLAKFGKLGEITNRSDFANVFVDAFLEVLGPEGTLLVPTFSYSFCNREIFDVKNTPSTVGLFTEELRKRKDACRSIHPIFSVAAIGAKAAELTTDLSQNSFGEGSVYDKLLKLENSKYLIFGVDYFACTLVHHIERQVGIPYRYVKEFAGTIINENHTFEDKYEFFVRHLDSEVNPSFDKIEKRLLDRGLMKEVKLGEGKIQMVFNSDIYKEGLAGLEQDQWFFLKNEPNLRN